MSLGLDCYFNGYEQEVTMISHQVNFRQKRSENRRGRVRQALLIFLCEARRNRNGPLGLTRNPKPQFPWTPCYPVYKKNCLNLLKLAVSCRWWQGKYYWGLQVSIAPMPWNITETNIWDCQPITFTAEILFSPGQFVLSHSLLPN